jgi:hypothetical protein
VNQAAIEAARKRDARTCLYGLTTSEVCAGALHVHHIDTRGSGGDDVLENLICLCTLHHTMAHNGLILKSILRAILTRLYNYRFGE